MDTEECSRTTAVPSRLPETKPRSCSSKTTEDHNEIGPQLRTSRRLTIHPAPLLYCNFCASAHLRRNASEAVKLVAKLHSTEKQVQRISAFLGRRNKPPKYMGVFFLEASIWMRFKSFVHMSKNRKWDKNWRRTAWMSEISLLACICYTLQDVTRQIRQTWFLEYLHTPNLEAEASEDLTQRGTSRTYE